MKYFGKNWYNNECNAETGNTKQQEEYLAYEKANTPNWYQQLSFHDSIVINVFKDENSTVFRIDLKRNTIEGTVYSLLFINYNVLEMCQLLESIVISSEIYFENGQIEFHLMVDTYKNNELTLEYFTIRCEKIEFMINGKHCGYYLPVPLTIQST